MLGLIFGPLLSLDTHALRSPQGIWQLYTAVYEDQFEGLKVPKLGPLQRRGMQPSPT
jgi:hypothetical protein